MLKKSAFVPYIFFSCCIFCSALLLFAVQPMISKALLPYFGGAAGVWGVALVFFQGVLCVGYGYGYLLTRLPSLRVQCVLHFLVAVLVLWRVWVFPSIPLHPYTGFPPEISILAVLALSIGVPYFFLTSTNTLMHHWFTRVYGEARSPYFLYSVSNAGSFGALLLYPFFIEPYIPLDNQKQFWQTGFLLFLVLLTVAGGVVMRYGQPLQTQKEVSLYPLSRRTMGLWLLCAAIPSGLLVATTTHITTDISPMPLLWVAPLALYLFSFMMAFRGNAMMLLNMQRAFPLFMCAVLLGKFLLDGKGFTLVAIELAALYNFCFLLHARLYHHAPAAERAGLYYLIISIGGVCGGMFAALLAPVIFSTTYEYYLLLVAVVMLRTTWQPIPRRAVSILCLIIVAMVAAKFSVSDVQAGLKWGFKWLELNENEHSPHYPLWQLIPYASLAPFFLCVLVAVMRTQSYPYVQACIVVVALATSFHGQGGGIIWRERNFYGVKSVKVHPEHAQVHILINGIVNHGAQDLSRPTTSISYYDTALENIFKVIAARGISHDRIAILGLGTGEMACVIPANMEVDYIEIDPLVVEIAENPDLFTYMRDCPAPKHVTIGDGRLEIIRSPHRYDVIFADAFTSDAIPVHLLTREAVQSYSTVLSEEGILVFHISNVYFALERVLPQVAAATGYHAWGQSFISSNNLRSHWIIFTKQPWQATAAAALGWQELPARAGQEPWSDNHSNMFEALRW